MKIFLVVHDIPDDVPKYDAFKDREHAKECLNEILDGYERDEDPLIQDSHNPNLWVGTDGVTGVQIVEVELQ